MNSQNLIMGNLNTRKVKVNQAKFDTKIQSVEGCPDLKSISTLISFL